MRAELPGKNDAVGPPASRHGSLASEILGSSMLVAQNEPVLSGCCRAAPSGGGTAGTMTPASSADRAFRLDEGRDQRGPWQLSLGTTDIHRYVNKSPSPWMQAQNRSSPVWEKWCKVLIKNGIYSPKRRS